MCSGSGGSDWMEMSWQWCCCCYSGNQENVADGIHQLVCQWTCMHQHVWKLFHPDQSQLTFIWTILIHQKKERCRRIKVVYTINSPGTSKDIKVSCKDFLKIRRTIHFQKCLECEGVVLLYHF